MRQPGARREHLAAFAAAQARYLVITPRSFAAAQAPIASPRAGLALTPTLALTLILTLTLALTLALALTLTQVRDAILGSDADGVPALNLTPAQVEQLAIHLPVYLPCTSPYLPR